MLFERAAIIITPPHTHTQWAKIENEMTLFVDPTVLFETFCKNADEFKWNIYILDIHAIYEF